MSYSEKCGRTVEEATALALEDLETTIDNVEVVVLEEPAKGFLGLGSKLAKVRVTVTNIPEKIAMDFLKDVTVKMGLKMSVDAVRKEDTLFISFEGKDTGTIIGKRGQTLDAIQYLTSLVVNKNREKYLRIVINAENYRQKREKTLEDLALRLADRVEQTGRSVRLEPMNPYERKIIHATLQERVNIVTKSEGEDPYRRIVIELK